MILCLPFQRPLESAPIPGWETLRARLVGIQHEALRGPAVKQVLASPLYRGGRGDREKARLGCVKKAALSGALGRLQEGWPGHGAKLSQGPATQTGALGWH